MLNRLKSLMKFHSWFLWPLAMIGIWSIINGFITNPDWNNFKPVSASIVAQGQYKKMLSAIIDTVNSSSIPIKITTSPAVASTGSIKTVEQIESGEASIGLVQSNTDIKGRNVKAISYVFNEYYIMLLRRNIDTSRITNSSAGNHLIFCTLDEGSQSIEDLRMIRKIISNNITGSYFDITGGNYGICANNLERGNIDGVFFVTGQGNETIKRLVNTVAKVVEIPYIEEFRKINNGLYSINIKPGLFGNSKPIKSIVAKATLLVGSEMDDKMVLGVYSSLYNSRGKKLIVQRFPNFMPEEISQTAEYYSNIHPAILSSNASKYMIYNLPIFQKIIWDVLIPVIIGFIFIPLAQYFNNKKDGL